MSSTSSAAGKTEPAVKKAKLEAGVATPTKMRIEDVYQKKTQLEHILLRPDTYIGSAEKELQQLWVLTDENRMEMRDVNIAPGLYKIFDEILLNAADNKQSDPSMNLLKVDINVAEGVISVWNNGRGIPVVEHSEHGCYIPELIFGHLLTSSNYNDAEKKTKGGRNGYGAKLANIFSTSFTVETSDSERKLKYKQTWTDNMSNAGKPKVSAAASGGKDYTCVTFKPDLTKFGMTHFDKDIVQLFRKRVYDVAGTTHKSLKVVLNGEKVNVADFKSYIALYKDVGGDGDSASTVMAHEVINDRWEVAVGVSNGHFQHVSFANNICTSKGGSHVSLVTDQLTKSLLAHLQKGKKHANLKPATVKQHLFVFVNALIENPVFDSQTKENLTCNRKTFGSTCDFDDKFLKKLTKKEVGICESIESFSEFKDRKDLKKNEGGKKKGKLHGIEKLDDANEAGGKNARDCTLILTEGDSAKALAVSGLSVVGRDKYGVFPLKGKLLNVREANTTQIMNNAEIVNLKQILGLKQGVDYQNADDLRYGHVMVMTDQDHDGSHIKGLIINLFDTFWPSLLKLPGFLTEFITPIVKVTKGKKSSVSFYTIPEYEQWKQDNDDGKGWTIKYYKGLGTSTAQEAKLYFSNLQRHKIDFAWKDPKCNAMIDVAFSKKKADDRKDWMRAFVPGTFLDQNVASVTYQDFVNKELILFSLASNERAIPSLVDGLKPGQRKILYACLKKKLHKEIKVAQLAGYVSEHAAYHHGEMSLNETIVKLAQTYVGSNNLNLLMPQGQFGTRLQGGKDNASPRYIFTMLSDITKSIFHPADSDVLRYLNDDGLSIEPEWYVPVIPMVLVNGSAGIGTGWSSSVPNYNPRDIVAQLRYMMNAVRRRNSASAAAASADASQKTTTTTTPTELHPWYQGFSGTIRPSRHTNGTYIVTGKIATVAPTVFRISELPLGTWTGNYKLFLEELLEKQQISDFKEYHTDTIVCFDIYCSDVQFTTILNETPVRFFKLATTISTSNMTLFTATGALKRYDTAQEILNDYFDVRLKYYGLRREHLLAVWQADVVKLSNKSRFIKAVIDETIIIKQKSKSALVQELRDQGYTPIVGGGAGGSKKSATDKNEGKEESMELDEVIPTTTTTATTTTTGGFDYLLSMPLLSLTSEKIKELLDETQQKHDALSDLTKQTPMTLWERDLDEFMHALDAHDAAAAKMSGFFSGGSGEEADQEEGDDGDKTATKAIKSEKKNTTATVKKGSLDAFLSASKTQKKKKSKAASQKSKHEPESFSNPAGWVAEEFSFIEVAANPKKRKLSSDESVPPATPRLEEDADDMIVVVAASESAAAADDDSNQKMSEI